MPQQLRDCAPFYTHVDDCTDMKTSLQTKPPKAGWGCNIQVARVCMPLIFWGWGN